MIVFRTLSLLLLTGCFSLLCANPSERQFTLVENGEPRAVILLADQAVEAARESAEELNYWVNRITGTVLPIVQESDWDGATPWIAIGPNKQTRQQGWESDSLGLEGARVVIEPEAIALLGNPPIPDGDRRNGIYNATLEFIRHALGVYWIWPGEIGEVYTPSSSLHVNCNDWTWQPDIPWLRQIRTSSNPNAAQQIFDFRNLPLNPNHIPSLQEKQQDQLRWVKRQRMNSRALVPVDNQVLHMRFGHSFTNWWDRFGDKHPDWFARPPEGVTQRGGKGVKLNLSNPEVVQQLFEDWLQQHRNNPNSSDSKFISVGPNDSRGFDTRKETRAWDPPQLSHYTDQEIWNGSEPILTDRHVRFWNTILEKIHQVDPEVYGTTYAYRNYRKPPLVEQVNEKLIIGYVGGEAYYPKEPWIREEWQGWADKGAKYKFWRPNLLHSGHGIPWLYSRQLFEDFRFFQQHGMMGTDFDSLTSNWAAQGLNYYVLAELHYRSDVDYETLVSEYFNAFGAAADTIRQYHEYFEELTASAPDLLHGHNLVQHETWGAWWRSHIRVIPLIFTDEVISHTETLLQKALTETENDLPVYRQRVETLLKSFEHQKLMAHTFRELQLHDPKQRVDYSTHRKTLQPLWNFRQEMMGDVSFDPIRLTSREQHTLSLWDAFTGQYSEPVEFSIPLSDNWQILPDPENQGRAEQWDQNPPESNWIPGKTEARWNDILDEQGIDTQSEIVWYQTLFEVPLLSDTNRSVNLYFESVDAEVHIWLNGWLVAERSWPHQGNYDSWLESFQVNITEALHEGPDNQLILRIRNERGTGGITGKVLLVTGE